MFNFYENFFQHHERKVTEKKKIIKELGRTIKTKNTDNSTIDSDLTELNVTVNERKLIDQVNGKLWVL